VARRSSPTARVAHSRRCAAPDTRAAHGVYFADQSLASIVAAVREFEAIPQGISAATCRAHAEQFSPQAFRESFKSVVRRARGCHPPTDRRCGSGVGGRTVWRRLRVRLLARIRTRVSARRSRGVCCSVNSENT